MQRTRSILYIFFLIIILLSSCRSRKTKPIEPKSKVLGVDSVFTLVKQNELAFENLKIHFNAKIKIDDKTNSFRGQIRMYKDSLIWLSISPGLGIEVARVLIEQDSVKLINRFNKTYVNENIEFVNSILRTDLDFEMLQAILIGSDIPYYSTKNFQLKQDNDFYYLNTVGRSKLKKYIKNEADLNRILVQKMKIDKRTKKIVVQDIKQLKTADKRLIVSYSDLQSVESQMVAFKSIYNINDKNAKIILEIDFNKITIDSEKLKTPFSIPDSYSEIE